MKCKLVYIDKLSDEHIFKAAFMQVGLLEFENVVVSKKSICSKIIRAHGMDGGVVDGTVYTQELIVDTNFFNYKIDIKISNNEIAVTSFDLKIITDKLKVEYFRQKYQYHAKLYDAECIKGIFYKNYHKGCLWFEPDKKVYGFTEVQKRITPKIPKGFEGLKFAGAVDCFDIADDFLDKEYTLELHGMELVFVDDNGVYFSYTKNGFPTFKVKKIKSYIGTIITEKLIEIIEKYLKHIRFTQKIYKLPLTTNKPFKINGITFIPEQEVV